MISFPADSNHGIDFYAVTVQNEPEFPAPWEACSYDPESQGEFIANHLGPTLAESHPNTKILIFDHNKDHIVNWARHLTIHNVILVVVEYQYLRPQQGSHCELGATPP